MLNMIGLHRFLPPLEQAQPLKPEACFLSQGLSSTPFKQSFVGFNEMVWQSQQIRVLIPFQVNCLPPLPSIPVISHLRFAITFLSFKYVYVFFRVCLCVCVCVRACVCTWSHVCCTKFPSSSVHFLHLHSLTDFILKKIWASLSFQFLGLINYFDNSDAFVL